MISRRKGQVQIGYFDDLELATVLLSLIRDGTDQYGTA